MESSKYLEWIKHLPSDDAGYSNCSCPRCGSSGLEYQYFGFGDNEYGWKLVWCNSCKAGIRISRAKLPTKAAVLVDEVAQKKFLDAHAELKLVS